MSEFEMVEKKSRFISVAARVGAEDDAKAKIAEMARQHKRANHVTFAYVLPSIERYGDDGEPRGTAGLPLLSSIKRRGLESTVVVVARYFGGILLGKGGLIRAYGKSAGLALDGMLDDEANPTPARIVRQ